MNILKFAFNITPAKRRVLGALAVCIALTSSNVQAVHAAELPTSTADVFDLGSTTQTRGIVVPDSIVNDKDQIAAPAVEVKVEKPAKKKWNTINSADLETKADHSDEPALRSMVVATTAYTSDPGETDASPFTTANGTRVYDGVIAANFLKFGTRVRIPDQFGNKVFVVHDRMNARYTQRVDIWMTTKSEAFKWGVRRVKIEILP